MREPVPSSPPGQSDDARQRFSRTKLSGARGIIIGVGLGLFAWAVIFWIIHVLRAG
jgi:hypothetical protein